MVTPGFKIWKLVYDHRKHYNFIFIVFMTSIVVGEKIKGLTNDSYKIYQFLFVTLVYIEFLFQNFSMMAT